MILSLNDARQTLIFPKTAGEFRSGLSALTKKLDADASPEALALASDLALDLKSHLAVWRLADLIGSGSLGREELTAASDLFTSMAEKKGGPDQVKSLREEAESIANSETRKISEKTRSGRLATFWGHDY
ncbi:MAG: hypothetical protein FWG74_09145, partial [Planctomycetes bacterium]|nr:hypothetical protein [Planctomycetota bacterium]